MNITAFQNPDGVLFRLSDHAIHEGLTASRKNRRKRMILPIHRSQDANVQRLINFLQPGTYIRPHLHPLPHATESIVLLQGSIRFFTFNENGKVQTDHLLTSNLIPDIVDIEPGTWHSFLVLETDTIIFECKKGPYDAKNDKQFAKWAPEEEDPDAKEFMKKLLV